MHTARLDVGVKGASPGAEPVAPEAHREGGASRRALAALVSASFARYRQAPLRVPAPVLIRAGRAGGLPFDSLTTDLLLGCLPPESVCYGNCFAARAAFEAGYDFGARVLNTFEEGVLRADLAALPARQAYLRNGWNSDPSWCWDGAARLAAVVREAGRLLIFVTKSFSAPGPGVLHELASSRAEIRVSVSAFDTDAQLRLRMATLEAYRRAGGIAIALVMTTRFRDRALNERQDQIVREVASADLPGAENSLRIDGSSPVASALDPMAVRPMPGGSLWCGRLYTEELRVPTTTSVPESYAGLPSAWASELDPALLASLFRDPVRTHEEVLALPPLKQPAMCGVARGWEEADDAIDEQS